MTRKELIDQTKLSSGGSITRVLAELEEGGFVSSYKPIKKNVKTTVYRLADFYTAFYYKFIHASKIHGKNAWSSLIDHPTHRAWQGYAFEQLSFYHLPQIKKALGIEGIHSNEASWNNDKAQIDLIIDRRDQVMNIIEIKFSLSTFTITKDYEENLRNKIAQLKEDTKTKKAVFITMMTTFGIQQNKYAGIVNNEITLDDLFKPEN